MRQIHIYTHGGQHKAVISELGSDIAKCTCTLRRHPIKTDPSYINTYIYIYRCIQINIYKTYTRSPSAAYFASPHAPGLTGYTHTRHAFCHTQTGGRRQNSPKTGSSPPLSRQYSSTALAAVPEHSFPRSPSHPGCACPRTPGTPVPKRGTRQRRLRLSTPFPTRAGTLRPHPGRGVRAYLPAEGRSRRGPHGPLPPAGARHRRGWEPARVLWEAGEVWGARRGRAGRRGAARLLAAADSGAGAVPPYTSRGRPPRSAQDHCPETPPSHTHTRTAPALRPPSPPQRKGATPAGSGREKGEERRDAVHRAGTRG